MKYQQGCQTQVRISENSNLLVRKTQENPGICLEKVRENLAWMLSMSLKVKDFFIVSGKSGNPRPEQCAELVGYIGDQHCSLN